MLNLFKVVARILTACSEICSGRCRNGKADYCCAVLCKKLSLVILELSIVYARHAMTL